MTEFNDLTQEEIEGLRAGIKNHYQPAEIAPIEDKKQDAADALRLKHVMSLPADRATAEDNAFLRAQILAGIRGGLS